MKHLALAFSLFLSLCGAATADSLVCHNAELAGEGGAHALVVEIANTPETRQTGLMHREEIADNQGMLFVFENEGQQPFWMQNTLVPLDIVHLGFDGAILQTLKGQPMDTTLLIPDVSSQFVLEVRQDLIDELSATHFTLKDITPCP